MGCVCAIVLTTFGASYGTAKSSVAIFASGVLRPDKLMQNTCVPSLPSHTSLIPGYTTRKPAGKK